MQIINNNNMTKLKYNIQVLKIQKCDGMSNIQEEMPKASNDHVITIILVLLMAEMYWW